MSLAVHRNPDQSLRDITYHCDAGGCGASPADTEIIAGGGLLKMGWTIRFNAERCRPEHFCPEHKPQEENPRGN